MPIILNDIQIRVKDTIASSPNVGLAVRANGEEKVTVIDRQGNVVMAGIPAPTNPPTLTNTAGGGLPYSKWYGYIYVWAAKTAYPNVENDFSINGSLIPRGNPSPIATLQTPASGANRNIRLDMEFYPGVDRDDLDTIWVFRTVAYSTEPEAHNAAQAGLAYFIGETTVTGGGPLWIDGQPLDGVDLVEYDNFSAPQFQFVIYYDPYWIGFGNYPYKAKVTWDTNGNIALVGTQDKWFTGREGQIFTLTGIGSGGSDGLGGYYFHWLTATTAKAYGTPTTPVSAGLFPPMGAGAQYITIQGPATTLYRSKARNPFSWGWTKVIGTGKTVQIWAHRVGGGLGTALAAIPNEPILKVDCEFPAKCYSFNLQYLDNYDNFKKTRRTVSDVFSVTSHWSQFTAMGPNGQAVLWGIDYKNFAIVQSNGISQMPISGAIPRMMRLLTQDRSRQILSHGVYDPYTQLNCIWVTTKDSISQVNFLIFQHAPSGFWGFMEDKDILCSASIYDSVTGAAMSLVGTESGLWGQAFAPGVISNWLPEAGLYAGTIESADDVSITAANALITPFNTIDAGMVGNWCLITDANDENEVWARIGSLTSTSLTFDIIASPTFSSFTIIPQAGWKFYVGVIECQLWKLFDLSIPVTDKKMVELWLTQQGVDTALSTTLIRFYREREKLDYVKQFNLQRCNYADGSNSDVWYNKTAIPSELTKSFTLEIINRGYQEWRLFNYVMKVKAVP